MFTKSLFIFFIKSLIIFIEGGQRANPKRKVKGDFMTNQELFNKVEREMQGCYESGIRCLRESTSARSAVFFRDFSQGQIDGIYSLAVNMYLELIYNRDAENEDEEEKAYMRFCAQIRKKANELRNLLIQYATKYM